jgi:prepilin-type N-terminal cleavage/methylation domain-containing protein
MKSMVIKSRGFTLMELMIVVAIIMILAAVGFSNYIFSLKKSHDAARKSDLATIAKGLEAFANDFTVYPDDDGSGKIKACGADTALTACVWGDDAMKVLIGGNYQTYLSKIPKDPVDGQYYYYIKTTDGFELYAGLENISDPSYSETAVSCGGDVNCNYTLTQGGVK